MSNAPTLVYIAYARADRAQVEPIVAALREKGISLALDAERTHGTGNYVHDSQQALRQADALIVFYSQAAAQSPWVEAETRAFQSRMAQEPERPIIIVFLDDTPLPAALRSYTIIHGSGVSVVPTVSGPISGVGTILDSIFANPIEIKKRETTALAETIIGALAGESAQPDIVESDETLRGGPPDATDKEAAESALPPSPPPTSESVASPPAPSVPAPAPAPPPYVPPPATPGTDTGGRSPFPPTPPATQPGYPGDVAPDEPSGAWSAAPAPAPQRARLEQVTFTAYHPREMQAQQWQPLVVYLSLDDPATMAQVASAAAERLAGKLDQFRPGRAEKSVGMARGTALRIVPTAPGIVFNPGHLDVTWQEDVQQHEFRMRAETARPGQAVNGVVQFYQGMLLRAEVPISVFVGQAAARLDSPDAYAKAIARAYRRIFASYSHQDMPVVESCETAAHSMGDQYLRDVSLLQSGQQWDPRLIQAINDADIFQLFWSRRAATSPFVEREWRHALMLLPTRPNFIRPVYWARQLYPTPAELNALHFQPLSLASLGWGQLRIAWYTMRNQ